MKDRGALTEPMFYVLMSFLRSEMCGIEITEFVARKTGRPGAAWTRNALYPAGKISRRAPDRRDTDGWTQAQLSHHRKGAGGLSGRAGAAENLRP